ncbi:MAG: biopolymer transporter ExbD [Rhizobiaceae bacterium]|nr:biopolymer transporter ExbD [Rhizobiaceae bacterium]
MGSAGQSLPPRPPRRRRASFVLTSLIDVIFLLVIFFMVTSQITPFSLIPLGAVASEGTAPPPAEQPPAPPVSVRILAGAVSIGGRRVTMDELGEAFDALKSSGVDALVVSSTAAATVQDLVTVLEAARATAFADVTVINRRTGAS